MYMLYRVVYVLVWDGRAQGLWYVQLWDGALGWETRGSGTGSAWSGLARMYRYSKRRASGSVSPLPESPPQHSLPLLPFPNPPRRCHGRSQRRPHRSQTPPHHARPAPRRVLPDALVSSHTKGHPPLKVCLYPLRLLLSLLLSSALLRGHRPAHRRRLRPLKVQDGHSDVQVGRMRAGPRSKANQLTSHPHPEKSASSSASAESSAPTAAASPTTRTTATPAPPPTSPAR